VVAVLQRPKKEAQHMAGPHGALSDGRVGDARTAPMGRTYVVLLKVRFKPSLNCNLSPRSCATGRAFYWGKQA